MEDRISTGTKSTNANTNAAVAELMRGAPEVDVVAATRLTLSVDVGFFVTRFKLRKDSDDAFSTDAKLTISTGTMTATNTSGSIVPIGLVGSHISVGSKILKSSVGESSIVVGVDHSIEDSRKSSRSCKRGKKERDKGV